MKRLLGGLKKYELVFDQETIGAIFNLIWAWDFWKVDIGINAWSPLFTVRSVLNLIWFDYSSSSGTRRSKKIRKDPKRSKKIKKRSKKIKKDQKGFKKIQKDPKRSKKIQKDSKRSKKIKKDQKRLWVKLNCNSLL